MISFISNERMEKNEARHRKIKIMKKKKKIDNATFIGCKD